MMDGAVRSAERLEDEQHLLLLDQLAHLLHRLGGYSRHRGDEVDLAAVDAALMPIIPKCDLGPPDRPMAEAGPLYGMMLPVLISLSVAPAVFLWASGSARRSWRNAQSMNCWCHHFLLR
jgi:hypothetical protein